MQLHARDIPVDLKTSPGSFRLRVYTFRAEIIVLEVVRALVNLLPRAVNQMNLGTRLISSSRLAKVSSGNKITN